MLDMDGPIFSDEGSQDSLGKQEEDLAPDTQVEERRQDLMDKAIKAKMVSLQFLEKITKKF